MLSEFISRVYEIIHNGHKRFMFGSSGSAELFHLLLFSWDMGEEHALIERNRLQITKKLLCYKGCC